MRDCKTFCLMLLLPFSVNCIIKFAGQLRRSRAHFTCIANAKFARRSARPTQVETRTRYFVVSHKRCEHRLASAPRLLGRRT